MTYKTFVAILAACLTHLTTWGYAEEFTALDGRKFTTESLLSIEPDGIKVETDNGIDKIPLNKLSPELKEKFGYGTQKGTEVPKPNAKATWESLTDEQQRNAIKKRLLSISMEKRFAKWVVKQRSKDGYIMQASTPDLSASVDTEKEQQARQLEQQIAQCDVQLVNIENQLFNLNDLMYNKVRSQGELQQMIRKLQAERFRLRSARTQYQLSLNNLNLAKQGKNNSNLENQKQKSAEVIYVTDLPTGLILGEVWEGWLYRKSSSSFFNDKSIKEYTANIDMLAQQYLDRINTQKASSQNDAPQTTLPTAASQP
jgi:hypothetical protein